MAVVFVENHAHVGKGAGVVVGGAFDPDENAMGTFALVVDFLKIGSVFAFGAFDGFLDVVLGHVLRLGGGDGGTERGVGIGIWSAGFGCHRDGAPQLGKKFRHFVPTRFFGSSPIFKCSAHVRRS